MTSEEILALLEAMKDDERSKILDKFGKKEPPKPEPPKPQEPPKPESPKPQEPPKPEEPPKPPKADSVLTMTAAEFMQLIEQMNKGKEVPKPPKKEDDDDAELYL